MIFGQIAMFGTKIAKFCSEDCVLNKSLDLLKLNHLLKIFF